jgi:hypothetical protein
MLFSASSTLMNRKNPDTMTQDYYNVFASRRNFDNDKKRAEADFIQTSQLHHNCTRVASIFGRKHAI